jgi:LysR family transcriptional regulator of abg operon
MKHHQLRALVYVAKTGSIRTAAKSLFLSQSAVTKALKELEEELGTELLVRSVRGITFTDAGLVLLKRARLAFSSLEQAVEEIETIKRTNVPHVSFATTPLAAINVLPNVLQKFEKAETTARISLSEGLLSSAIPDLIEGRIDFAVVLADKEGLPTEIMFEPLAFVQATPAGRPGNPLTKAKNWADLKDAKWVLNLSSGSQAQSFLSWLEKRGIAVEKIIRCASPHLMAEIMRRSDALSFCPKILLDDPMYGNGLTPILIEPLPPPMTLGLMTRRKSDMSSATRTLVDLFKEEIALQYRSQ